MRFAAQLLPLMQRLKGSAFARSVAALMAGTLISQLLTIAILPLLTRIYSPEQFGSFAVYSAVVALGSVSVCLRFELAIPLPESNEEGFNLLAISLASCTAISLAVAFAALLIPSSVLAYVGQSALQESLFLIPLGIWLAGTTAALQSWAMRSKKFTATAKSKVTQAGAATAAQLGFGLIRSGTIGLIGGQLLGQTAGLFHLASTIRPQGFVASGPLMRQLLKRYANFPKFSTIEAIANTAANQGPIVLVAFFGLSAEAGFLMLASRAMATPVSLIGTSVSQVFLSRAPTEHRSGRLSLFTQEVLAGLVKTGVGPLLFAGIVAPGLFSVIFGDNWARAGYLVAWLTPAFILQFLTFPISTLLHVTDGQRTAMALQLAAVVFRCGSVLLAGVFAPAYLGESYAASGALFYLLYFAALSARSQLRPVSLFIIFMQSRTILGCWIMAAALVVAGTRFLG